MNDDDRLKEGFAKLRADDARRAPPFEAMWSARPRRRSPWIVAAPMVSMAAAAAVILVWCRVAQYEAAPSAAVAVAPAAPPAIADDPAPLDFLLDVPMGASLAKVPDFDKTLLQGKSR